MDDAKRKEIETRLRQMINAANRNTEKPEQNTPRPPGNIQVIRRRKGSPDLHITWSRLSAAPVGNQFWMTRAFSSVLTDPVGNLGDGDDDVDFWRVPKANSAPKTKEKSPSQNGNCDCNRIQFQWEYNAGEMMCFPVPFPNLF
jgi:hypothetical protein